MVTKEQTIPKQTSIQSKGLISKSATVELCSRKPGRRKIGLLTYEPDAPSGTICKTVNERRELYRKRYLTQGHKPARRRSVEVPSENEEREQAKVSLGCIFRYPIRWQLSERLTSVTGVKGTSEVTVELENSWEPIKQQR